MKRCNTPPAITAALGPNWCGCTEVETAGSIIIYRLCTWLHVYNS
jgi:hypothetical protein